MKIYLDYSAERLPESLGFDKEAEERLDGIVKDATIKVFGGTILDGIEHVAKNTDNIQEHTYCIYLLTCRYVKVADRITNPFSGIMDMLNKATKGDK